MWCQLGRLLVWRLGRHDWLSTLLEMCLGSLLYALDCFGDLGCMLSGVYQTHRLWCAWGVAGSAAGRPAERPAAMQQVGAVGQPLLCTPAGATGRWTHLLTLRQTSTGAWWLGW
jgi:hypothetical protein